MEIRYLIWFKKLAETGSMTKAAEELYISQPHLSKCINEMEAELGVKLFDRIGRGIVLNNFGKAYYKDVVEMFELYDNAKRKLLDMAEEEKNCVSIYTNTSSYLPGIMKHLLQSYNGLYIHQKVETYDDLLRDLLRCQTDFVISSPLLPEHDEIETRQVRTETGVVIYPEGHKFENQEAVSSLDIFKEPLINVSEGQGLRIAVDELQKRLGLKYRSPIETSDVRAVFDYVNEGLGIAIVPESMAKNIYGTANRFKSIAEAQTGQIGISWRKGRNLNGAAQVALYEIFSYFNKMKTT